MFYVTLRRSTFLSYTNFVLVRSLPHVMELFFHIV